jgi:hypothetical protein
MEYGHSESDLDEWAHKWSKTAAEAGFLSTLVESLGTMSMTAPVTKNAARLIYQILLHLGFTAPSQKQHFEILSSAGSLQGFIVRVLDNLGKKEWAESGMLVVSAILAGKNCKHDIIDAIFYLKRLDSQWCNLCSFDDLLFNRCLQQPGFSDMRTVLFCRMGCVCHSECIVFI